MASTKSKLSALMLGLLLAGASEDADWNSTAQGAKSAGDTSFTLAWKPGESGQQGLVEWFNEGDVRGYKIKYPNGAVDVFRGWVSSLGKAIPEKEVIIRSVKVTNTGKPSLAEDDRSSFVPVTGLTVAPATVAVKAGKTKTATFRGLYSFNARQRVHRSDTIWRGLVSGAESGIEHGDRGHGGAEYRSAARPELRQAKLAASVQWNGNYILVAVHQRRCS